MAHSVLAQIAAYRFNFMDKHGHTPTSVMISEAEHKILQQETGSEGSVVVVEGVMILIGEPSELPQEPKPVPDIKDKHGENPFTQVPLMFTPKYYSKDKHGENPFTQVPLMFTPKYYSTEVSISKEEIVGPPLQQDVLFGISPDHLFKTPTKDVKVYHQSISDEHGTPMPLFQALDKEFHFDLDVCATAAHEVPNPDVTESPVEPVYLLDPGNAKCPIYFTQDDNGLLQSWFGTVWMNPPYTKGQVGVWIAKLIKEMIAGHLTRAVALVAARPDTQWFHAAASHACEIRFLKGRLTFEGSVNPAPFPSALLIFNPQKQIQQIKFWDWKTDKTVAYYKSIMAAKADPAGWAKLIGAPPKHPQAIKEAAKYHLGVDEDGLSKLVGEVD